MRRALGPAAIEPAMREKGQVNPQRNHAGGTANRARKKFSATPVDLTNFQTSPKMQIAHRRSDLVAWKVAGLAGHQFLGYSSGEDPKKAKPVSETRD
jgi:hypothetical protein